MRPTELYLLTFLLAAGAAPAGAAVSGVDPAPVELHIPAGPLDAALSKWADETHSFYFKNGSLGRGISSPGATGSYTPVQALDALLANTGLTYIIISNNTVRIRPLPNADRETGVNPPRNRAARDTVVDTTNSPHLEEVVVTGSHIPGASSAYPIRVYTREDIDHSGAASSEEFISLLTQIYTGQSEFGTLQTLGTGPAPANPGFGTGANLRGLGASSTLVLVDGHRLAPSGNDDFVDVSMIPFAAIERVEVLTDGASAIYGSDAVGGVVNFILRRDYGTTETSIRLGESTHADARSYDTSQAIGRRWKSGGALLSLQLAGHGAVNNQDREFSQRDSSALLYGPRDLSPRQLKQAFYGSLDQNLPHAIEVSTQGFYTKRRELYHGCVAPCSGGFIGRLYDEHASNAQYASATTLTATMSPHWKVEISADASQSWISFDQTSALTPTATAALGSDLWSVTAGATGVVYEMPAGDARISFGASHRSKSFRLANSAGEFQSRSAVEASYTELQLPLIRPDNRISEGPRLSVTLAGRYEHYSTFGSTFNPKVGIQFAAAPALGLRASYSSAFKAPTAYQLSEFNAGRFLRVLPDNNSDSGQTLTLIRYGGNPQLRDQTANIWTIGFDWDAPSPGAKMKFTYFNVDYQHIIWDPATVPSASILSSQAYSGYVSRRRSAGDPTFDTLAESVIGNGRLIGCTPPSPGTCTEPVTDIGAIIDQRQANLASAHTSGFDWSSQQVIPFPVGKVNTDIEASYIVDYRQRVTPAADAVEIANTAGNPPRVHLRSACQWSYGRGSLRATLNFTGGYSTRGSLDVLGNPLPLAAVASWTTIDLQLGYNSDRPHGLHTWLNVANLFDVHPPHVDDRAYGFGYDPANATPFGRVVSVQVRKEW